MLDISTSAVKNVAVIYSYRNLLQRRLHAFDNRDKSAVTLCYFETKINFSIKPNCCFQEILTLKRFNPSIYVAEAKPNQSHSYGTSFVMHCVLRVQHTFGENQNRLEYRQFPLKHKTSLIEASFSTYTAGRNLKTKF